MQTHQLAKLITEGARKLDQDLADLEVERLVRLLFELKRWSARMNLTAITELELMVAGHVLDSLAVRPFLHGERVLDVGTGAGFPGLPLAITEPQREFYLLDSTAKKLGFIRHIAGELGLSNVQTVKARAEDYAPASGFATVIARAVATIPQLLEWAGQHVAAGGVMLALKGRLPEDELKELPENWGFEITKLSVPGLDQHERHVVTLTRRTV